MNFSFLSGLGEIFGRKQKITGDSFSAQLLRNRWAKHEMKKSYFEKYGRQNWSPYFQHDWIVCENSAAKSLGAFRKNAAPEYIGSVSCNKGAFRTNVNDVLALQSETISYLSEKMRGSGMSLPRGYKDEQFNCRETEISPYVSGEEQEFGRKQRAQFKVAFKEIVDAVVVREVSSPAAERYQIAS